MARVESHPQVGTPSPNKQEAPSKGWATKIASLGAVAALAFGVGQVVGGDSQTKPQEISSEGNKEGADPQPENKQLLFESMNLPSWVHYTPVDLPVAEALASEPEKADVVRTKFLIRWEAFKGNNAYLLENYWLRGFDHFNFTEDALTMSEVPNPRLADNPRHLVVDEVREFQAGLMEASYHLEKDGEVYQSSTITLRFDEDMGDWGVVSLDSLE